MELQQAQNISQEIIDKLSPYCQPDKCVVAGSIRRKKRLDIHDVDLVLIPNNQGKFITACQDIGRLTTKGALQLILPTGVMLDLYIATPDTWATLLLIRTGSKEHNIKLCSLARQKGMVLHADGSGLFNVAPDLESPYREARIAGDTEESIFEALGLPYKRPEERN